jgi:hypothetical protein
MERLFTEASHDVVPNSEVDLKATLANGNAQLLLLEELVNAVIQALELQLMSDGNMGLIRSIVDDSLEALALIWQDQ